MADQERISAHYAPANLAEVLIEALRGAGKNPEHLSYEDLAPLDQFHTRGKIATLELARAAKLAPGARVLDVGGGLGGSARLLAAEFGCLVTVLDLSEMYCRVGEMLTRATGQLTQVNFRCASALDVPFADESFDVVWTQHSSMNIEDKERLYNESHRVLVAAGHLAIHEIMAGPRQPIHFPVPWAPEPALSFLRPVAEMRSLIERAGFTEIAFNDETAVSRTWLKERAKNAPSEPPPLGLHLILGNTFVAAVRNQLRNLEEERVAVIQAVYRKN